MLSYNGRPIDFGHFPNGESYLPLIKIDKYALNHIITLKYENDEDLFHLLMLREALGDLRVTLRITYVPYSRMDRDNGVYHFSLLTFTSFINAMNWEKVVIYEPHSDVTSALLDAVQVVDVTASPIMQAKINVAFGTSDYQTFYPDAGAQKRYSGFESGSPELDKWRNEHELLGLKKRDFATGKILEYQVIGERASDNVVILDDLCSKGGTFMLAGEKLREMGFKKIILAVAHCENTIFSGGIFLPESPISKVITTDSLLVHHGLDWRREPATTTLEVIPLAYFRWNYDV